MKRLVLVNPSEGFNPWCIPLGLTAISAYLKKHYQGDLEITLLDAHCQNIYKEFYPADIVAVTASTQDIGRATEFAKYVKTFGNIPVILGGVHITTYRKLPEPFDIGVIGEGEITMLELVQLNTISKDNIGSIKGICANVNGETLFTRPRPLVPDLDIFPIPDRDIADMNYYFQPRQLIPYHTGRTFTLLTSRGCNFNCVFCSTHIHWQKFRAFSAPRVIAEIEELVNKYGAEIIHIVDDLFIADKRRIAEIHRLIIEKGINKKVKFMCLVRSDMLDDKTMTMLKEMNVVVTGIGMESGCPKTLKYLKHNTTTIEKNRKAIELSAKYGIPTMGSFMFGNPYETEEEIMQTLKFMQEYRYTPYLTALPYIAIAYPGTEFWRYAKAKGLPDNFDNLIMDIPDNITALKNSTLLTDIPVERFFEISRLFRKEAGYSDIKQFLYCDTTLLNYIRVYLMGMRLEMNLVTGILEVSKIIFGFRTCKKIADRLFVPVYNPPSYNYILDNKARDLYKPVINQMFALAPKMMSRKIPEANVQQAFVMNAVHLLASGIDQPKILCVGSFEDTAAACLKATGHTIEEIDPSVNYDLDTYLHLPTVTLGSFDIIFSTSVLEHVDDDRLFISQIAALLKPGGVAVLTCDFNNMYRPGDKLPQTDIRFYTKNNLLERILPCAKDCSLIDDPMWDAIEPDFTNEGCRYTFATITFKKDPVE